MRGKVASILIVLALLVGGGLGYFSHVPANYTATVNKTYTATVTLLEGGSDAVRCVLAPYTVWEIERVQSNSTSFGSTTETTNLTTYQTTTSAVKPAGYVTTYTTEYTGTISGALAKGNYTICTYTSS